MALSIQDSKTDDGMKGWRKVCPPEESYRLELRRIELVTSLKAIIYIPVAMKALFVLQLYSTMLMIMLLIIMLLLLLPMMMMAEMMIVVGLLLLCCHCQ